MNSTTYTAQTNNVTPIKPTVNYRFAEIDGEEWLQTMTHEPCSGKASIVRCTPIISKEAFIKCYNRWIKNEEK